MNLTEQFISLLNRESEIRTANIFILKNDKPKKIKIFPEEVNDILLKQYFEKLRISIKNKEFVGYLPDITNKGTLQVLPVTDIDLWTDILGARNNLRQINLKEITVKDYKCEGNTILVDIEFQDNDHAYLLTIYKNIAAWFRNSTWLKRDNGKFHRETSELLALTPYVDAVIYKNNCFIINENNFIRIFKFDEVIDKLVDDHKDEIASLNFISDIDEMMEILHKEKRYKKAMAKVIMQNRIDKIKKFSNSEIRRKIQAHPQLYFIDFDEYDKVIINKDSCKAIVDILRGVINLDLITGELNGVEENEQIAKDRIGD